MTMVLPLSEPSETFLLFTSNNGRARMFSGILVVKNVPPPDEAPLVGAFMAAFTKLGVRISEANIGSTSNLRFIIPY